MRDKINTVIGYWIWRYTSNIRDILNIPAGNILEIYEPEIRSRYTSKYTRDAQDIYVGDIRAEYGKESTDWVKIWKYLNQIESAR